MAKFNVKAYAANTNPNNPSTNDKVEADLTVYLFLSPWDKWFRRWNRAYVIYLGTTKREGSTLTLRDLPKGKSYTFRCNYGKKQFVRSYGTGWSERNISFNFP